MGSEEKDSTKRIATIWLAQDPDGDWHCAGWKSAHEGDSEAGESADSAIEWLDSYNWRLHRITIELPDPPAQRGPDLPATVSDAISEGSEAEP